MSTSDFDLELFIRSFEEAGAIVSKSSGQGKLIVGGVEKTGYSALKSFFDNNRQKTEISLLIEGKVQIQRTDFPSGDSTVLAA